MSTGDMTDADSLTTLVDDVDAVVHCAYAHAPGRYRGGEAEDRFAFWRTNLLAGVELMERARLAGVKRLVLLSSRAVFGRDTPAVDWVDDDTRHLCRTPTTARSNWRWKHMPARFRPPTASATRACGRRASTALRNLSRTASGSTWRGPLRVAPPFHPARAQHGGARCRRRERGVDHADSASGSRCRARRSTAAT